MNFLKTLLTPICFTLLGAGAAIGFYTPAPKPAAPSVDLTELTTQYQTLRMRNASVELKVSSLEEYARKLEKANRLGRFTFDCVGTEPRNTVCAVKLLAPERP